MIYDVTELNVYNRSVGALDIVYQLEKQIPQSHFKHKSQLTSSAESVPSLIAEGFGKRRSDKEWKRFLEMAIGSSDETITHARTAKVLSKHFSAIDPYLCDRVAEEYKIVSKQLNKLRNSWVDYKQNPKNPKLPDADFADSADLSENMLKLNAKELRRRKPTKQEMMLEKRNPLYIVLDNVLDTYNIGGLFRLAEAVLASDVVLCGQTETPPSSRIHKAAVGTEEWVTWSYSKTAVEAVRRLKSANTNLKIVAVEQGVKSIPYTLINELLVTSYESPVSIVVGHETEGVSQNVLDMADFVLEIPMFGVNKSLNVIVSAAIVTYKILENFDEQ